MLNGKVVLVTGAAGRIGATLAKSFVSEGARVVLVDVNRVQLDDLRSLIGSANCISKVVDVCSPDEIDQCIEFVVEHFGGIDAAVHSAYPRSAGWGTRFEEIKKEHLDKDLSQHLGGAILFSQRILEFFKTQGYGNLIHIASIMGVVTPRFENYAGTNMTSPIEYTAIKAAVIAMTRYLAKYYKGGRIRVNCISPGGIFDQQPESFLEKYRSACNGKGMLDAYDLVGTVVFLLSEHSQYVTGQNIIIDDGWSL